MRWTSHHQTWEELQPGRVRATLTLNMAFISTAKIRGFTTVRSTHDVVLTSFNVHKVDFHLLCLDRILEPRMREEGSNFTILHDFININVLITTFLFDDEFVLYLIKSLK